MKRRVFKQTELFPDLKLLGARFGGSRFSRWARLRKLDDRIRCCGHVFGQCHDALVLDGGEPRRDRVGQTRPTDRDLPKNGRAIIGSKAWSLRRAR